MLPDADTARRCSHALSRIRYLDTTNLTSYGQYLANMYIIYMTGLTCVELYIQKETILPQLTLYCHQLTTITLLDSDCTVKDILYLCHANPLLQELRCYCLTDTALIELIHSCPHLHTIIFLSGMNVTDITDVGVLALSECCPQLQTLHISKYKLITEVAVLQLLQCCRKLTALEVSSSSLSEETWTQLDKNTQKRVIRCE